MNVPDFKQVAAKFILSWGWWGAGADTELAELLRQMFELGRKNP